MAIFSTFAAIVTKRNCASQFIFAVEQEKNDGKKKTKQPAPQNRPRLGQNFDVGA
jgi:hypothetical protein